MSQIVRDVRDIEAVDRFALEHLIGQRLRVGQRVIIDIVNVDSESPCAQTTPVAATDTLPEWCNLYREMSDEEIEDIERSIVRSPGGRYSE